jgi:general secretion pathway protein I
MSDQRGFTLLEVLVAMAFFAIAFAGVSKAFGDLINNSSYIQERVLGQWIAENQLAALSIEQVFDTTGNDSGSEDMAGRTWYWNQDIKNTAQPDVRKVIIEVRTAEQQDTSPVATLEGYLGRY